MRLPQRKYKGREFGVRIGEKKGIPVGKLTASKNRETRQPRYLPIASRPV